MTMPTSKMTQVYARVLAWAGSRGSALRFIAIVIFLAGLVLWLLGLTDLRGLLSAIGSAMLVWAIGSLLYRTLGH